MSAMRCFRCRKQGIESIMIKNNGWARCPRCGREVRYMTKSEKKNYDENMGCLGKVLLILLFSVLALGLVITNPWLLLLLIIPIAIIVYRISKS